MNKRLCIMLTSSITATTFLHGYLKFLQSDGWEVTLICTDGPGVSNLADESGINFVPLSVERHPSPFKDFRSFSAAVRILRRIRPDVLVYATPKASLIGALAGTVARVPRRAYEMWGLRLETATGLSRKVLFALEWLTIRLSSIVISNSRSMATRVRELGLNGGREVLVLGEGSSHGVDSNYFSRSAEISALTPDLVSALSGQSAPIVGFVGRMHPDKGIDVLLDAVRMCADRGLNLQLLIAGAEEGVGVPNAIVGERATVQVHASRFVQDVRPILNVIDILVLPSRREGFPNVVLEAAAMNVPAIVTSATGCVDAVIDGVTGRIVPVDDANGLADAIVELLGDDRKRQSMATRARCRVVADFVPQHIWALHSQAWKGTSAASNKSARITP